MISLRCNAVFTYFNTKVQRVNVMPGQHEFLYWPRIKCGAGMQLYVSSAQLAHVLFLLEHFHDLFKADGRNDAYLHRSVGEYVPGTFLRDVVCNKNFIDLLIYQPFSH